MICVWLLIFFKLKFFVLSSKTFLLQISICIFLFTNFLNLRRKYLWSCSTSCPIFFFFFSPNNIPGLTVWAEGQPGVPPSFSTCSHRPRLLPLRPVPVRRPVKGQNGHKGDHQHPEGLAAGTPEEPLPHQRREDHACYHYENDTHTGGQRDMFSELNLYKMFQFSGLSGTLQAQFGGHQPPGPLKINP